MSKRARYDGPYQEVAVFDPEADVYAPPVDKVKQGGLLSKDVPARIRDSLLEGAEWTAVGEPRKSKKSAPPGPSSAGEGDATPAGEKGEGEGS